MSRELRLPGQCECGRPVVRVLNSDVPTFRRDGVRYAYPETIDAERVGIFLCQDCGKPIDQTWKAEATV